MLVFAGYTALCCLLSVSGRTIHLPHTFSGDIFHHGLHGHTAHTTHLTSGLWQYLLSHFGHSQHHPHSHHTHSTDQEVINSEVNITSGTIKPETQPTQGNEIPEVSNTVPGSGIPEVGTDQSVTTGSIDERQSFGRWKDQWLLNHLSTCGDQPIEPVFPTNRIIGGRQAVDGSWPWMVSFYSKTIRQHVCAGTIIDSKWIVSAAHCFVEFQLIFHHIPDIKDDLEVRVGLYNNTASTADQYMQTYHADHILVHPEFELDILDNDIALVHLDTPISFTDHAQPVCLFGQDAKGEDKCIITGWGRQKKPVPASGGLPKLDPSAWPNILKQAAVPILDHTDCGELYMDKLTSHMICAGYLDGRVDACNGDSGGPLLCQQTRDGRWSLTGITSWGGTDYKGCAEADLPGVYTKVSGYYHWVLASMYSLRRL
ncbi:trypsin-like [Mizuhopecten yessoensis]|uniref:Transmembrane protease serine 9 n=1 Tax=Mizuhopecten yessoensis TaxID=6573 RepID=A0A210QLG7_MIZYE|nr:trypsin-like [Mizuhopecten yessoensis]OWF49582.1 Transmembrane protease serine 9 [Mizuhopecten yessoensis]